MLINSRINKIYLPSKQFENESHYVSGYIAHNHIYYPGNIRTDILIYPSIQTDKSSLNFAIHPNAVLHKMFLKRIFFFKVNSYEVDKTTDKMYFSFEVQDELGINNQHGYLAWRNLPNEDMKDFKKLFPDLNEFPVS